MAFSWDPALSARKEWGSSESPPRRPAVAVCCGFFRALSALMEAGGVRLLQRSDVADASPSHVRAPASMSALGSPREAAIPTPQGDVAWGEPSALTEGGRPGDNVVEARRLVPSPSVSALTERDWETPSGESPARLGGPDVSPSLSVSALTEGGLLVACRGGTGCERDTVPTGPSFVNALGEAQTKASQEARPPIPCAYPGGPRESVCASPSTLTGAGKEGAVSLAAGETAHQGAAPAPASVFVVAPHAVGAQP